jgi:hypothetical protein
LTNWTCEMRVLPKLVHKFWEHGAGRTALAAFCAHSVSISIGICQGYSAILIPQLNSSYGIHVDSEESSWLGECVYANLVGEEKGVVALTLS